ncbi:YbaB/EbfC family nucleoid-associated protein [Actinomadura sp. ATCC 31491]|uniref:YbaB/EbfC family nucleoid-associated protein n=1 Tax=Actinomadura luzonensis TaxID=2805427 RepID=A0ABT0FJW5_9ACTN|nr:YbaB/EbfC family nucleoid-associated protein [Actinomadura luzonensis]MCK2212587.1 YbaB/EbfC family nucleoid-associated protein [Actinomadura luzonensis]
MLDPGDIGPEDLERVARETETALRRLADVQSRLGDVRGTGTAADGMIVVGADSTGRVDSIKLNPRVMRLGSQELADHLLRAVTAAQDDCARQAQALIAEAGVAAPVDEAAIQAMERRLMQTHEAFVKELGDF